ncbi:MAG: hypothetical protein KBC19_04415 [Candidatus Moranbacteria bacterium]|nr:hypothetical protein [Candidatus Moranbacteria bacterium]
MDVSPFAMYDIGAGWLAVTMDFLRHSFLFSALRAFLLVYVVVLFIDIILLLVNRGVSGDLRATLHGTDRPLISRNQMIVRWEKIRERLEGANISQYKVAILEAEALAEEILTGIGWKGEHIEQRLGAVTDAQLESRPALLEAHQVRNLIILDPQYQLSREEAEVTLGKYKRFLDEVELF